MVKAIRGDPVESEESAMFLHNRRLIATQNIPVGCMISYGINFGAYLSMVDNSKGLNPASWQLVEGRKALVEIKRGNPIGEGDFG